MLISFFSLMTDASSVAWAGFVASCPAVELDKPVESRSLQPVAFVGGTWSDTQRRWSMPELEVAASIQTIERTQCLLERDKPFYLMVDAEALLRCYSMTQGTKVEAARVVQGRVSRWASYLSRFQCYCVAVSGESNWACDYSSRYRLDAMAPGPWSPHLGGEATTTPAASQAAGAGHHDGEGDDAGARATTAPAPAPAPDSDDARATNDDEAAEIMAVEAEVAAMAEIYDYNAARVQPLDHPAFTYPAVEEIAAAQEDALRRPDNPPALGTIPPRLESQAQDRIEVGDATTINGRTTRRTERGVVEVDVTSVQGKRYLPSQWRVWIPVARIDLHARLTVAAHGGLAAHQGALDRRRARRTRGAPRHDSDARGARARLLLANRSSRRS
jgi:hypothetical protein